MTDHEVAPKLEQLSRDEAFIHEFLSSETPEAAQAKLEEQGIEISLEEVTAMGQALANTDSEELNEEQLSNVAGGSVKGVSGEFKAFIEACKYAASAGYYGGYYGAKAVHSVYKWFKSW